MCLQRPEEGIGSPETGVAGGCELPCGFWEPNFGRLQEQQLSTGVEYLVTVKIGRTKCKKSEASNASCPLQSSKLKKSLICTSLIYTVPWVNYYQLWNSSCQDSKVPI
ncbi:cystatin-like 1 [Arvicola amphibius]|uniref:cystatin-like 1 n=1 Tax=Arvicola amphibius TaxID=1047088 RepID=UPI001C092525|nr:cystatin-like 1 [Arvicola amphibius]